MLENTESQRQRQKQIYKIEQMMGRIDSIIDNLLEGIDFDEIKPANRCNLAIKFMSLYCRYLVRYLELLKNSVKPDESGTMKLLAAFQRHLRGEEPIEE